MVGNRSARGRRISPECRRTGVLTKSCPSTHFVSAFRKAYLPKERPILRSIATSPRLDHRENPRFALSRGISLDFPHIEGNVPFMRERIAPEGTTSRLYFPCSPDALFLPCQPDMSYKLTYTTTIDAQRGGP